MAKLTIRQIQDYLQQAGWPSNLIPTAAAVFMYESGGDTTIGSYGNAQGTENSWGLAQINLGLPGTALARERASWGPKERLFDPVYNLQLALQIYNQQGWYGWKNTYYGGRYQQYMAASNAAWNGASSDSGYIPDTSNNPSSVPDDGTLSTEALIGIFVFGLGAILFLKSLSD